MVIVKQVLVVGGELGGMATFVGVNGVIIMLLLWLWLFIYIVSSG
jgi:hypothetical protein